MSKVIFKGEDIAGEKFGKLTIIKEVPRLILPCGQKPRRVLCKCDCGNTTKVLLVHLIRLRSRSCGCTPKHTKRDVIGHKYGTLTAISEKEIQVIRGRRIRFIEAKCECGNLGVWRLNVLRYMKSCGCLTSEILRRKASKYGLKHHRIYCIWHNMKNRCYNPKTDSYKYYGLRGIKVCKQWLRDFKSFYDWAIKNGWQPGLSIDRIKVNGNYTPKNCRWATNFEQQNNKRTNIFVKYKGEKLTLKQLARKINMDSGKLHRLYTYKKIPISEIIETHFKNWADNMEKAPYLYYKIKNQ